MMNTCTVKALMVVLAVAGVTVLATPDQAAAHSRVAVSVGVGGGFFFHGGACAPRFYGGYGYRPYYCPPVVYSAPYYSPYYATPWYGPRPFLGWQDRHFRHFRHHHHRWR